MSRRPGVASRVTPRSLWLDALGTRVGGEGRPRQVAARRREGQESRNGGGSCQHGHRHIGGWPEPQFPGTRSGLAVAGPHMWGEAPGEQVERGRECGGLSPAEAAVLSRCCAEPCWYCRRGERVPPS